MLIRSITSWKLISYSFLDETNTLVASKQSVVISYYFGISLAHISYLMPDFHVLAL